MMSCLARQKNEISAHVITLSKTSHKVQVDTKYLVFGHKSLKGKQEWTELTTVKRSLASVKCAFLPADPTLEGSY